MNTYVLGEITTLLVVSVLAGILIGWCIKSLLASRSERQVRSYVARDVDSAMADVESLRATLARKDESLASAQAELQKMRGRDISMKAGNTSQVEEINKLKNELAVARQSLDRNRTEFNSYRNDSQKEVQALNNKLARYTAGGPVYDERMSEAGETISALRNATRENDRVIESLRARVKEGDSTVENLRSQLKSRETAANEIERAQKTAEESAASLNAKLKETAAERDQLKRDYDTTLSSKNSEIGKLQSRLEDLGKTQTELKQLEHQFQTTNKQAQENSARAQQQITELKQTITHKEAERAAYLKDQKRMQQEIADLQTARGHQTRAEEELNAIRREHAKTQEELQSANALKTQVENKSAEVVALNDMLRKVSDERKQLQTRVATLESQVKQSVRHQGEQQTNQQKVAEFTAALAQRDADLAKLRSNFDEVADSRNRLGIELGELQSNAEKSQKEIQAESEKQLAQLAGTIKDRDQSFARLRKDMDDMTVSRNRLTEELKNLQSRGAELETFKSDMQSAVANRDSELAQRTHAYQKLQTEFNNLSKLRDDYEVRIEKLKAEIEQQSRRLQEQEERSRTEIAALKPQISDLRSKLSLAHSDNQKISSELSDSAALKLAITDKESVIQKLQIDLQEAKLAGTGVDKNAPAKVDSLTAALRDRDEEIARLNASMTDNRLSAKQSQSEISLLKQEIDSQSELIKGLEEQAENTLVLHKKIAAQSTEIEELRARLYQGDTITDSSGSVELASMRTQLEQKTAAYETLKQQLADVRGQQTRQAAVDNSAELKDRVTQLQSQLNERDKDIQRLKNESRGLSELKAQHEQLQSRLKSQQVQAQRAPQKSAETVSASSRSETKPRVFVRADNPASTESLTGVSAAAGVQRKVAYTRDGYRIKHADGRDNLALLPGISGRAELELNKHGVTEFEQIVLWGNREVLHFAERSGIASSEAEGYNWPKLAREILQGTYRRAEYLESDRQ
jgi:chromosome segregation ATPase